ncbi:hypothetical protein [Streptomyces mirabilis]|uniref:hypothetical protein n=1 Tax=Streptomyces mirabilis TaxID=68239 RepID=UPI0032443499
MVNSEALSAIRQGIYASTVTKVQRYLLGARRRFASVRVLRPALIGAIGRRGSIASRPAAELAGLCHAIREAESAFPQIKTFQRGPVVVLRSGDPDLLRQEIWAHLTVHHRLTRIIVGLADDNGIDPGRVSFIQVLKHSRRSGVRLCPDTPTKINEFLVMLAAKVHRKLDNGIRPCGKRTGT